MWKLRENLARSACQHRKRSDTPLISDMFAFTPGVDRRLSCKNNDINKFNGIPRSLTIVHKHCFVTSHVQACAKF